MMLSTAKRKPYASRACLECQRRKTKCTEERPCPSCRSREVECLPSDTATDNSSIGGKRSRLLKSKTMGPTMRAGSDDSLDGDNKALREEIRKLRRDVNLLSREPLPSQPLISPLVETFQFNPDWIYPLQQQISQGFDHESISSDSSHTDTFTPSSLWASPGAIANKINLIRATTLTNSFLSISMSVNCNKTFSLTLPAPGYLQRQIDLFLFDFDQFAPFFCHFSLQKRIHAALNSVSYSERHTKLDIPWDQCTIFAILCNILSHAEVVTPNNSPMDSSAGYYWYTQGKRLMEEFENTVGDSVETVVYHVLAAGSLMESERLRTAASHIVKALQAALSIGLNDKDRCKQEPDDIVSRRCLWWVLYFAEKRIHYKCGIPYLLHPDDANIDRPFPLHDESEIDETKLQLVEGMVSYAQLWTSLWSTFLAPNASLAGNWPEVQIADARVVIRYKELPQRLLWNTGEVQEYINNGVAESAIRQKLQVFLWHQSLRLIIRQPQVSGSRGNAERLLSRFNICKDTIAAISSYVKNFSCLRPIGYFLTCSLVDCIFYTKATQLEQPAIIDQDELRRIFLEIDSLLNTLALSVGAAQRALAALHSALTASIDCNQESDFHGNSNLLALNGENQKVAFNDIDPVFSCTFSDAGNSETFSFLGVPQG